MSTQTSHMKRAQACALPNGSRIQTLAQGSDFADAYRLPALPGPPSLMQSWLLLMGRQPGWMQTLMRWRNRLVQPLGLKNLGEMTDLQPDKAATQYREGDRVGIFRLETLAPDEIIMGDNDRHLHVQLSLRHERDASGQDWAVLSTVVHIHNGLGRLYMAIVGPAHRLIVPFALAQSRAHAVRDGGRA